MDRITGKKIRIKKLFLLAAAIEDTPDEVLGTFSFNLDLCYHKVQRWTDTIYIYHSRDDAIVPLEQSLKLKTYFPYAIYREFENKGHFYKETELPEMVEDIKS